MNRMLIVGATGVLGSAATKYFLQKKFSLKAFIRNKDKAATLEKAGAAIFVGDITNTLSIVEACKNIDVVIATLHGMLSRGKNSSYFVDDKGHKNLIDAAVKAGTKHFIYISVVGAAKDHPIDFFRTKYAIEQYLINSGLYYTILRLPAFMEWHVHNLLGKSIVEKGKTTILGKGNNPTNFIAVDDIVQVLGLIVADSTRDKIITLAGPENISRNEAAKLYGKVLNINPRINHVPIPALKFLSKVINPFHPGIGRIMKLSIYGEENDATMNINDSIKKFGLKPTTVEVFIRKQVSPLPPGGGT
jgi:NADH dehydrogenase